MNDFEPEVCILTPEQSQELERLREREFRDQIAARYGVGMARKAAEPREMLRLARAVALELVTDTSSQRRKRKFATEFLLMDDAEAEPDVCAMLMGGDDRHRDPRAD